MLYQKQAMLDFIIYFYESVCRCRRETMGPGGVWLRVFWGYIPRLGDVRGGVPRRTLGKLWGMTYILLLIIALLVGYIVVTKRPSASPQDPTFDAKMAGGAVDKDAWEPVPDHYYQEAGTRKPLGGIRLHIRFQDLEGNITERDISTLWFAYDPATKDGLVYAFCQLRQANRPFAFKRVQRAVDLETGEIIVNLGDHLDSRHGKSPAGVVERFLAEHGAAIFVLFSFAKADGIMRAKERVEISAWATRRGLEAQHDLDELERQVKGWYSTNDAFRDAIKILQKESRSAEYLGDVWAAVTAIIQGDKVVADQEIDYLKYASAQLALPMPEILRIQKAKR